MNRTRFGGEFADVLRLLNEATSAEELGEHLKLAETGEDPAKLTEALLLRKSAGGGTVNNADELLSVMSRETLTRLSRYAEKAAAGIRIEKERLNFTSLLLANPNYFGTVPDSILQPQSDIKGNNSYEDLACVGLNTPLDRLEAVIHIKKNGGYSGGICTNGSIEWVRFYVDLHDNGIWHDAGLGWVRVHDIGGKKPLKTEFCLAAVLASKNVPACPGVVNTAANRLVAPSPSRAIRPALVQRSPKVSVSTRAFTSKSPTRSW